MSTLTKVIKDPETGAPVRVPLTPEEETDFRAASPPEPRPIPAYVTKKQLKLALIAQGHYQQVVTFINTRSNFPSTEAWTTAMIHWTDSETFQRKHALTEVLRGAVGLTNEQTDALWTYAATLS